MILLTNWENWATAHLVSHLIYDSLFRPVRNSIAYVFNCRCLWRTTPYNIRKIKRIISYRIERAAWKPAHGDNGHEKTEPTRKWGRRVMKTELNSQVESYLTCGLISRPAPRCHWPAVPAPRRPSPCQLFTHLMDQLFWLTIFAAVCHQLKLWQTCTTLFMEVKPILPLLITDATQY